MATVPLHVQKKKKRQQAMVSLNKINVNTIQFFFVPYIQHFTAQDGIEMKLKKRK